MKRKRMARWPMMLSRCPRPPQPQNFSLGIEGHDDVAAFPDAGGHGVAPIPDAIAQGPDANQFVELPVRGGDSGGYRVGVV